MGWRRISAAVLTVWVALTFGGIVAAAGNWSGWRTSAVRPTVAEATAAVRVGVPDGPLPDLTWSDDVRDYVGERHPDGSNLPGERYGQFDEGPAGHDAFVAIQERYRAAGWAVRVEEQKFTGGYFIAYHGGLVAEWSLYPAGHFAEPAGDSMDVYLWRSTPPRVTVLTIGGWLLGGALGAVLTLRLALGRRRWLVITLIVVSAVCSLSTFLAVWFTTADQFGPPGQDGAPTALALAYFPFLIPLGYPVG